jgi:uncharacterized protein
MIEIILISILGLVMGIVSAICGGSGVFGIPIMLAFGIPPINVLALNKTADVGVVLGALRGYHKSKSIDWKLAAIITIPLTIGSFLGASIVVKLPDVILKYVILVGVFVGIFLLLKKTQPQAKSSKTWVGFLLMFIAGIWGGALAMAGATFAVLIFVYFFHKSYLQARSTEIVAAIPETLVAATILIVGSTASFVLLATISISSFIGSWIGSHLAVKHGNEFIRKAMVGIAVLMIVKVVLDLV